MTRRGAGTPLPALAVRGIGGGARSALAVASALFVSACATLPAPPTTTRDTLSGRLALQVEAFGSDAPRAFSAAFDLRGDAERGTLGLATPFGNTLAQARWSPAEVVLATPRETRSFANLGALTSQVLGENVPIEAWFDWLRGRPWPGAPSKTLPDLPHGFAQLGWRVDLGRFDDGAVIATRTEPPPTVTVRIRLDRW